jgi:hypothetical protein
MPGLNAYAIYDNIGYNATFGSGHDIYICNNGNTTNCSANLNNSYKNEKYRSNDINSFERFSGSKTMYFKVK